ncbi:hypothetical protein D3C76_833480 [compost metagenome]
MKVQTFFLTQPLQEMQVGFVLHAIQPWSVLGAQLEAPGIGLHSLVFQHTGDDLRHAQVLKNTLVMAVGEIGEPGYQSHLIAGQAFSGIALGDLIDVPVNTGVVRTEAQKHQAMQQRIEVQVGPFADQFELDLIGPVQRFLGAEFKYLKVVGKTFNVEFENDLPGIA